MKKTVAVLFGGCSPEYGVSLQSAYGVLTHIPSDRYQVVTVGITREGEWYLYTGPIERIPEDAWYSEADCTPVALAPGRKERALLALEKGAARPLPIDAAFPVLHGRNGEDGTVQGLFELAGIPLVGCGVLSCALCMDKVRAHALVRAAGVAVPEDFPAGRGTDMEALRTQARRLGYPLFVKPVRAGSSFGITRVTGPDQLPQAVKLALAFDERIVLEQAISGFEVGCAVFGNEELTVGEPDEIELSQGFFDFAEKYTLKTSAIHVPARVTPEQRREIQRTARLIYRTLDCRGFARVDLFLEPGGRLVFNEVNTIPGFTAHSRYPAMMAAAGLPFEQVITRLIEQAVMG